MQVCIETISKDVQSNILNSNAIVQCILGTAKDSIFVRPSQPDQLYKLKDGIKFHLFINTAPCGDARIFSPHETEIGIDKHPNR